MKSTLYSDFVVICNVDYDESPLEKGYSTTAASLDISATQQVTTDPGILNSSQILEENNSPFRLSGLDTSIRNCYNVTAAPTLSLATVNAVERFVFFVGYARSGHSMIGSVMDAHPNMVIAHEYFVLEKCSRMLKRGLHTLKDKLNLFNSLYSNSYLTSKCGWRSDTNTSKGYNFNLDFNWQGTFEDKLRVIGDKSGNSAVQVLATKRGDECLKDIISLNISLTAVHVVRNPFDMIATSILYKINRGSTNRQINGTVHVEEGLVYQRARGIFSHANTIERLRTTGKVPVVEVHIEDYIQNPRTVILEMCQYFNVECPSDYVQECVKKAYRHVSRTRDLIEWPRKILYFIQQQMKRYSFFSGYTIEDSFRKLI